MIVCLNCERETKAKMDSLLRNSQYKNYSELFSAAVENLWMLEMEVAEKGTLIIDGGPRLSDTPTASPPIEKIRSSGVNRRTLAVTREREAPSAPPAPAASAPFRIPDLFLSEGLGGLSIATANFLPKEGAEKTFTLDRWLFGQYNKLLPAKVNCRALVRIIAGHESGAPLDSIASQIAEAAALLGDYLADYDRRHQIGRDDALAIAFPRTGPDAEKSRARYANQFVGSVNSQGVLSGLLWDYRLAAFAPGEGVSLLPTEAAVNLARLINPVLDACQTEPTQKFSPEEKAFLLEHIRSFVPVEAFTFRTLIQAIASGADTPDKLDEALRELVPPDTTRSLSSSFLASQRSGALSRMADLGLVTRVRQGVRVSYLVSQLGHSFFESK